ncbi:MAG: Nif3-like dinuclear metal center hexameric protein, partial [Candidatus Dadabacteria bacterium]|nr:Nif3-like dinuclear metal center hexameric protein [Candidatus Dadabacteria bacterium]
RKPRRLEDVVSTLGLRLGCEPKFIRGRREPIRTVGIVSGGGGSEFREVLDLGLDCFVTGETSYHVFHKAVESGVSVVFAGHYHTETPGLHALAGIVGRRFKVRTVFADVPGPSY